MKRGRGQLVARDNLGGGKVPAQVPDLARLQIDDLVADARLGPAEVVLAALRERRIAGAALDVYDQEPLPAGHPLMALDNAVLTPHSGFVTAETYASFFGGAVDQILAFLDGKTPPRALNPDARRAS